jgi:hypothetical protein
MGIRIFLKSDHAEGKLNQLPRPEYRYKAILSFGLSLADSIRYIFTPESVTEWYYLVGEEAGGERKNTWSYDEFKNHLYEYTKDRSLYYSIFRVNGNWKIGDEKWKGFISINISPLLGKQGDIYIDIIPGYYEDINDIIISQGNHESMIKNFIEKVKSITLDMENIAISIRKIIFEDEEHIISVYSKDEKIVWRLTEEYLNYESEEKDVRPIYNWDKIYGMLMENKSSRSALKSVEEQYGAIEEHGSLLLIGKNRDSLDRVFNDLSGKMSKFMEKLEPKKDIEQKISETFEGFEQTRLEKEDKEQS